MIEACIFDLDGTLVDSIQDIAHATNLSLSTLGFATHSVDKYKNFVGNGSAKLIERVLPEDARSDENKKKMRELFMQNYSDNCLSYTKPFDGIVELLAELKKRNMTLAVVSNKPDKLTKKITQHLFPGVFVTTYGNMEGYPVKPSPCLTLKLLDENNLSAQKCAFIGDSNVDIETAISADLLPIGVSWGFRSRAELQNAGAKFIVDKPDEILNVLK